MAMSSSGWPSFTHHSALACVLYKYNISLTLTLCLQLPLMKAAYQHTACVAGKSVLLPHSLFVASFHCVVFLNEDGGRFRVFYMYMYVQLELIDNPASFVSAITSTHSAWGSNGAHRFAWSNSRSSLRAVPLSTQSLLSWLHHGDRNCRCATADGSLICSANNSYC